MCNADDVASLEAVDVSADFSPALLLPELIQSGRVAGGGNFLLLLQNLFNNNVISSM